jgi:hypothetical protein
MFYPAALQTLARDFMDNGPWFPRLRVMTPAGVDAVWCSPEKISAMYAFTKKLFAFLGLPDSDLSSIQLKMHLCNFHRATLESGPMTWEVAMARTLATHLQALTYAVDAGWPMSARDIMGIAGAMREIGAERANASEYARKWFEQNKAIVDDGSKKRRIE